MSGIEDILYFKDDVYEKQEINQEFLDTLTIETDQLKSIFLLKCEQDTPNIQLEKDLFVIVFNEPKKQVQERFYQQTNQQKYLRQYFTINELQINIAEHKLVPYHELVDEQQEKDFVCRNLLCTLNQLPVIKQRDPMARYIGARLGDIVRIVKYQEFQNQKYVKELSYRAVLTI